MAGTTTNLGIAKPTAHSDPFTPQEDIAAVADAVDAQAPFLGLSGPSIKRRGKSIIATSEARTNTAYGLLTTPDIVSNIVVPTDGLLCIAYQATWQESVAGAASAAIFLGANQLVVKNPAGTSGAASLGGSPPPTGLPLVTTPLGLVSSNSTGSTSADATTGQAVGIGGVTNAGGGPVYVFAAAGTYDVSIQFKASSGSVTVRNRKLWVWTASF